MTNILSNDWKGVIEVGDFLILNGTRYTVLSVSDELVIYVNENAEMGLVMKVFLEDIIEEIY